MFQLPRHRWRLTAVAVAAISLPITMSAAPAVPAAGGGPGPAAGTAGHGHRPSQAAGLPSLPAPPAPPGPRPRQRDGYRGPSVIVTPAASRGGTVVTAAAVTPSQAVTWGNGPGSGRALVLYDSTDAWGWLGELYGIAAGNLASHFGSVTAEPVVDYISGQVNDYSAIIYLGSTYNEPIPVAFLDDVLSTSRPVIWAGSNIWQLAGTAGSTASQAFTAAYGWDPASSYFDTTDNPLTVSYNGQTFTRNPGAGAAVLAPHITDPSLVTVLASANCTDSAGAAAGCAPIAQSGGTSFPWAIRSGNLTYVGEIPFSYMSETDRYVAFSDLLFPALDPAAAPSHLALVRLEDVSPATDPAELRAIARYLSAQRVPFSINVIPEYTDPDGYYNNGVPQTVTLAQAPGLVSALQYALAHGGTLNMEGYTHQYSDIANPYDGVTGDDAEFFRARCATTQSPPYTYHDPCQNSDYVVWGQPLPGDSYSWALGRVQDGLALFSAAGLAAPQAWVTPHYFASAADYAAIDSVFKMRYEREVFASGMLSGQSPDYSRIFGQFFPYQVHDLYGEQIVPENLGDYEPVEVNNNPPRTAADIIANARLNLAVTQGTASFFFDPSQPLRQLKTIVSGIRALGYTFVSPTGLPG